MFSYQAVERGEYQCFRGNPYQNYVGANLHAAFLKGQCGTISKLCLQYSPVELPLRTCSYEPDGALRFRVYSAPTKDADLVCRGIERMVGEPYPGALCRTPRQTVTLRSTPESFSWNVPQDMRLIGV